MRGFIAMLVVALAGHASSGCFKATFIDPAATRGEEHEEWEDFFLLGAIGREEHDVRRFCPGPVALVRTGGNFLTGFVTVITLGIYAPRKTYVTCAAQPGASVGAELELELDAQGDPVRARRTRHGQVWVGEPRPIAGVDGGYSVRLRKETTP